MAAAEPGSWFLELPTWLIQDGHEEVARGSVITESVECHVATWSRCERSTQSAEHTGANQYQIRALMLAAPDPYILDLGTLVVGTLGWPRTMGTELPRTGESIEAEVSLQLDSFGLQSYVGPRYQTQRRWLVESIDWRPSAAASDEMRSVERTEGNSLWSSGSYILGCRDLDGRSD